MEYGAGFRSEPRPNGFRSSNEAMCGRLFSCTVDSNIQPSFKRLPPYLSIFESPQRKLSRTHTHFLRWNRFRLGDLCQLTGESRQPCHGPGCPVASTNLVVEQQDSPSIRASERGLSDQACTTTSAAIHQARDVETPATCHCVVRSTVRDIRAAPQGEEVHPLCRGLLRTKTATGRPRRSSSLS